MLSSRGETDIEHNRECGEEIQVELLNSKVALAVKEAHADFRTPATMEIQDSMRR